MSWGHFANFYMPPYKAGVEAGAATVMSAFNDFENRPCTGNEDLLRGLLKEKWGFQGFVVSDWGSVGEMVNHRYAKDQKEAANKAIMAGYGDGVGMLCPKLGRSGSRKESAGGFAGRCCPPYFGAEI
jgi:beta-glucosidase-like glycosyl hydrolase